jgi:ATP-dependent protease ClpP protease subunit
MNYRLAFNGVVHEVSANALRHRIPVILEREDCETLTILFSSEGGSTDQGLALYNFIHSVPRGIFLKAAQDANRFLRAGYSKPSCGF